MKKLAWLAVMLLTACTTTQQAPVIERAPASKRPPSQAATRSIPSSTEKDWRPDTYIVRKGDTLYSIGLEYGVDYKEIAQWNNILAPYPIYVGQKLIVKAPATTVPVQEPGTAVTTPLKIAPLPQARPLDSAAPAVASAEPPLLTEPKASKIPYSEEAMTAKPAPQTSQPTTANTAEKPAPAASGDEGIEWSWPATGKIVAGFNDTSTAKGLDIAGTEGQPVLAAASGKVVYSGSGLRGYGNLVIIKHNKTYLSAYAHNKRILVKEGQAVARGQKIAEMGNSDAKRVQLHFEIRKLGKPVDPAGYLPAGAS